jgi:hypothetical protein
MPTSSRESIQAVFDQLGLSSEADRQRFRSLGRPLVQGVDGHCPIRLDIGSSPVPVEEDHAKLASASGRDQGQG